jgi:hypothetical protein
MPGRPAVSSIAEITDKLESINKQSSFIRENTTT